MIKKSNMYALSFFAITIPTIHCMHEPHKKQVFTADALTKEVDRLKSEYKKQHPDNYATRGNRNEYGTFIPQQVPIKPTDQKK